MTRCRRPQNHRWFTIFAQWDNLHLYYPGNWVVFMQKMKQPRFHVRVPLRVYEYFLCIKIGSKQPLLGNYKMGKYLFWKPCFSLPFSTKQSSLCYCLSHAFSMCEFCENVKKKNVIYFFPWMKYIHIPWDGRFVLRSCFRDIFCLLTARSTFFCQFLHILPPGMICLDEITREFPIWERRLPKFLYFYVIV